MANTGAIVIASLAAGLVVGGLGYRFVFGDAITLDQSNTGSTSKGADSPTDLAAENTRLREEIEGLKVALGRHELARKDPETQPAEAAQEKEMTADIGFHPLFNDPKYQDVLANIDWTTMGTNMQAMVPLIAKLAEAMEKGEDPDLAVVGEIQKLNGDLMAIAQTIMEAKVPGSGINGSFTHPVVVANQLGAALKAAGMELSENQAENLQRIMQYYTAKDDGLRLVEGDRELKLENLLEEADFKDAFYREARGLLTEEQRAALFSEHSAGRTRLDVFDTGLLLAQYAQPIPAKDAADLASTLSRKMGSDLALTDGARKQLDAVLSDWAQGLPKDFWSQKASKLDRQGMMKSDRIRAALKYQTALMRQIMSRVELTAEDRANLLKSMRIIVPLPR